MTMMEAFSMAIGPGITPEVFPPVPGVVVEPSSSSTGGQREL